MRGVPASRRPSLVVNGIVVYFDNTEEHSAYVRYEHMHTQLEYREYSSAFSKTDRATTRRRLDLARQRSFNNWLKERGK